LIASFIRILKKISPFVSFEAQPISLEEQQKIKFLSQINKKTLLTFGNMGSFFIFTTVFHRILDFKNGAGSLSWPLCFLYQTTFSPERLK